MWREKPPRIQRIVLIQDYKNGGLRHLDYCSFLKAQKLIWIQRMRQMQAAFSFRFLREYMPNMSIDEVLSLSMDP